MEQDPDQPKKKRFSLREEFNATFRGLRWDEIRDISKDTLKDLTQLKEIFTMAAAVVLPGGIIAYPVYRIRKFRNKQKPPEDKPPAA